jgi:hypothetical protein
MLWPLRAVSSDWVVLDWVWVFLHPPTSVHLSADHPCRVPLPTWGCVLMLAPASLLCLYVLVLPFMDRDWHTVGATLGSIALGFTLYPLLQVGAGGW